MVVDKLDVVGMVVVPAETEAPLAIDTDAELAPPVAFQSFEPVSRWDAQINQSRCGVKLLHLCERFIGKTR